jgi:hypothetical protein
VQDAPILSYWGPLFDDFVDIRILMILDSRPGHPPPNPKTPFYIFFWGLPRPRGAAASGGGANLAKCLFLMTNPDRTNINVTRSRKRAKKVSETMLETTGAKF